MVALRLQGPVARRRNVFVLIESAGSHPIHIDLMSTLGIHGHIELVPSICPRPVTPGH